MAELNFRNILISLVFFSLVITAAVYSIKDTATTYPDLVNSSGNFSAIKYVNDLSLLDVLPDLNSTVTSLSDKFTNLGNSTSWTVTTFGFLVLSAATVGAFFTIVFNSITIPFKIVTGLWQILPLPLWFKEGILVLITLTFLFLIVQIILKYQNT